MKKIILVAVILFSWVLSAQGADLKIGYVDLNKALNESDSGKKAKKTLEDMVNSKKSILVEKEIELKKLQEELEKQSSVLTPEAKKSKEEQFNKLLRDYQKMVKDFGDELQKKEEELSVGIQKDLIEFVNKLGKDEGYTIIFGLEKGARGIIYSPDELNLTDKVIKKYNEITNAKK